MKCVDILNVLQIWDLAFKNTKCIITDQVYDKTKMTIYWELMNASHNLRELMHECAKT